jgi:hypothetical protein
MLTLLLLACGAAPLSSTATTDGGTWEIALPTDTYAVGEADLVLTVTADGAPATGLEVHVHPGMEGMDHGGELEAVEGDRGVYTVTADLSMGGLWQIEGEVHDGDAAESFALEISVE